MTSITAYTDSASAGTAQVTLYEYNGRDLQTKITYEETGDVLMEYDDAGNLTSREDEAGVIVNFEYDALDRLKLRYKDGSGLGVDRYAYDALGRLTDARRGTPINPTEISHSHFEYDTLSRVTSEAQALFGTDPRTIEYDYDKAGRVIEKQYPHEVSALAYYYDNRNRPTVVYLEDWDPGLGQGPAVYAEYDWLGSAFRRRTVTTDYRRTDCEDAFANDRVTIETIFERDHLLRVTEAGNRLTHPDQAPYDNVGIYGYAYQSNKSFNVTAENQFTVAHQIGTLEANRAFDYDTLDRLIEAELTDSPDWSAVAMQTSAWDLDNLGNWLEHTDRDATPITRTFDKANRMNDWGIVNTNTLHDLAGNQVKIPVVSGGAFRHAFYDALNRLREIKTTGNTEIATFEYDALGRRIRFGDDKVPVFSKWYYYDGVNEILETTDDGSDALRWFVHGVSYIDERLMMHAEYDSTGENEVDASYYYAIDRMYDVRLLLDAAGAIVESYSYDPYGRPLIRECAGRGDMTGDSVVSKEADDELHQNAHSCTIFDPRADMDDDGDVDEIDRSLFDDKDDIWDGTGPSGVKTARSLVGNPYMFQGRPHFVFATNPEDEQPDLMLNDHRNRFADPMTGRWLTRDPIGYADSPNLYEFIVSSPQSRKDAFGLDTTPVAPPREESASQPASPESSEPCKAYYVHSSGTYPDPVTGSIMTGHSGIKFDDGAVRDWVGISNKKRGGYRQLKMKDWISDQAQNCESGNKFNVEVYELELSEEECKRLKNRVDERSDLKEFDWEPNESGHNGENCSTCIAGDLRGATSINIPNTRTPDRLNPVNWFTKNDRWDSWGKYSVKWLQKNKKTRNRSISSGIPCTGCKPASKQKGGSPGAN